MASLHRLTTLLDYASREIPYYLGCGNRLEHFPIVRKHNIVTNYSEFLSNSLGGQKSKLLTFLERNSRRNERLVIFDKTIYIDQTSGSTGTPFRIPRTNIERTAASMAIWKYRHAIDPKLTAANFYAFSHRHHSNFQTLKIPRMQPDDMLEELNRRQIRWIHLDPELLEYLCHGKVRTTTLRYAESTGFQLSPAVIEMAKQKLGIQTINQYGCMETWVLGTALNTSQHFKILTDNVVVELIDDNDNPVQNPGFEGRVIVTSLHQHLFPFIRYDTGDRAYFVNATEKNLINLIFERQCNKLVGVFGQISGRDVFKAMMSRIYNKFGHFDLPYIQIRQQTQTLFYVVLDNANHADIIVNEISFQYNKLFPANGQKKFIKIFLNSPEGEKFRLSKRELFTSSDCISGSL